MFFLCSIEDIWLWFGFRLNLIFFRTLNEILCEIILCKMLRKLLASLYKYLLCAEQTGFVCALETCAGQNVLQSSGNRPNISVFAKAFGLIPQKLFFSTYHCFLGSRLNPVTLESSAYRSKTSASMMRSSQVIAIRKSVWWSRKRETQSHRKVMSYWFDRLPREIGQAESLWLFKSSIKEVL